MDENKNNDLDINDTGDGFFDDVTKEEPTYKEENTDGKQGESNREKTPAPTPKKKVWKRIVAVVAAVSAVFFAFSCGVTVTQRDMDDEMRTLMNIKNTIQKEYYQNITDEEFYSVIFDAINNDLLDDYSEYMTYEEYLAMTESLAGKRSGIGVAFSVKRLTTRKTLPSTAAARFPKAIDAIAPAVYAPTPDSVCNNRISFGNAPSKSKTICLAAFCKFLARL